jgi:type I restriction enzyme S subunit
MARKMKDSGIEWIGEIPEGWEITKIKHIVSSVTDIDHFMPDSAEFGIPYLMIGDLKDLSSSIDWDSSKKISIEDYKKLSIKSRPQIGDIIFARYASIGTTCYIDADRDFLVSYACLTIHPSDLIIGKFLSYYLKSSSFAEDVLRRTNSNTQGNVGKDSLVNATIVLPSIIEQTQIVNFLDAKCSDIYAMLSKTRSSIEEYKKLKQAVITQAVTKGVRGEREMKDSGVEWIGEIPVEWSVAKAKYYVTITHGSDPKTEGSIPVYGSGAESFKTCGEYKEGPTVLIGRKGATLHIPHYIEGKYWNVDTAFDVKAKNNFSLPYYYYLATSFDYKFYIAQTTLPGMTQSNYYNMFLPLPTFPEQEEIVNYLDAKCAEIDKLIAKKEQLVKELESYKKSLIYEVVTGKREV